MGESVTLTAEGGHQFDAYLAKAAGDVKGRLVVFQEIFGVNNHIRNVCDRFAADGYTSLAPALFDRAERNVELGYTAETMEQGRALRARIEWDDTIRDARAAIDHLRGEGPVGVIGYCWGGSVVWLAACRIEGLACASGYYGAQVAMFNDEQPKCPTLLHFGEHDPFIPLDDVEKVRAAHPDVAVHVYKGADHGFECDERASYDEASRDLARARSLALFAEHMS